MLTGVRNDRTIQRLSFKEYENLTQVNKDCHCVSHLESEGCDCSLGPSLLPYVGQPETHTNLNPNEARRLIWAGKSRSSLVTEFNAVFDFYPLNQSSSLWVNIYGPLTSDWPSYWGFTLDFVAPLYPNWSVFKWIGTLTRVLWASLLFGFDNLYGFSEKTQFNSAHTFWALTLYLMLG